MARPRLNIDPDKVRQYALIGLKTTEIAGMFGCDEGTLRKRFKREIAEGRAQRMAAIRKAQWDAMKGGNVTMLIWLGKNELGQSDQPNARGDGEPEPQLDPKVG
jgi:hypothetical protein